MAKAPVNLTFVTIMNGVDTRFTIIMNEQTGYYNITKTATLFSRLQNEEAGVDGNSRQPRGKLTNDWFRNTITREQLDECATMHSITVQDCKLVINEGVDNSYRGTYVHPMMYDHFMTWLSPKYAMRVSSILKIWHQDANRKIIKEKDDKIDQLKAIIEEQAKIAETRFNKLIGVAEETKAQNEELLEEVKEVKNVVIETNEHAKSISRRTAIRAIKPGNEPFIALMFALLPDQVNGVKIRFILRFGKYDHLMKTVFGLLTGDYSPSSRQGHKDGEAVKFQLALPPTYMPAHTTLAENAKTQFEILKKAKIAQANYERKTELAKLSSKISGLKKKVMALSALDSDTITVKQRAALIENQERLCSLETEKSTVMNKRFYRTSEIPIKFKLSTIDFQSNQFIRIHEITKIFTDLVIDTHSCIYLNSSSKQLLEMSKKNEQEFLKEFNNSFFDNKQSLLGLVKETKDAATEMMKAIAESCANTVLNDIDVNDESALMEHFKKQNIV
jgi:KilA-N domain